MRKILAGFLVCGLVLSFSAAGLAEKKKKPEVRIEPTYLELRQQLHSTRIQLLEEGPLPTERILQDVGEEIDYWGTWVKRIMETGNLMGVYKRTSGGSHKFIGAFEVSFTEGENVEGVTGVVPREDEKVDWMVGVKWKGVPLLGDFADIFKRVDVFCVLVGGHIRPGLAVEFRPEEVKERVQD